MRLIELTLTGQMKYLDRIRMLTSKKENRTVIIQAPTNPSTVFFGESLMSCVRPNIIPQMYANMSLVMTSAAGRKNQIIPSKMLFMTKWACTTIRYKAM